MKNIDERDEIMEVIDDNVELQINKKDLFEFTIRLMTDNFKDPIDHIMACLWKKYKKSQI